MSYEYYLKGSSLRESHFHIHILYEKKYMTSLYWCFKCEVEFVSTYDYNMLHDKYLHKEHMPIYISKKAYVICTVLCEYIVL